MSASICKNDFILQFLTVLMSLSVLCVMHCFRADMLVPPTRSGLHCRRSRVLVILALGDVLLRALPEKISFFRGYLRSIDYIFL